jgi:hypothetical protein
MRGGGGDGKKTRKKTKMNTTKGGIWNMEYDKLKKDIGNNINKGYWNPKSTINIKKEMHKIE